MCVCVRGVWCEETIEITKIFNIYMYNFLYFLINRTLKLFVCTRECMKERTCACLCVCMYVCMYVCVCVCVCSCVCVCVVRQNARTVCTHVLFARIYIQLTCIPAHMHIIPPCALCVCLCVCACMCACRGECVLVYGRVCASWRVYVGVCVPGPLTSTLLSVSGDGDDFVGLGG